MEPVYHLGNVVQSRGEPEAFEGPLSLILTLLSKNKIEIKDISISLILEQYLQHLAQMERMDLEIASEFVQMASHLVYIKTKTLLEGEEKTEELQELVASLEQLRSKTQFEQLRQMLPMLRETLEEGMLMLPKPPEPAQTAAVQPLPNIEPHALLRAITELCARGAAEGAVPPVGMLAPQPIVYSVEDKSRQLLSQLRTCGSAGLREILLSCSSRSEIVAAFLSILELCSAGQLMLCQDEEGQSSICLREDAAEKTLESAAEMDYS